MKAEQLDDDETVDVDAEGKGDAGKGDAEDDGTDDKQD